MVGKHETVEQIREAFGANPYPGDSFLQGSFEGCEPYDEVGPFVGKTDWEALDAPMLDAHYCALGFFSEAGFRYFLPADLLAALRGELRTADPLFHLSHGFSSVSVEVPAGPGKFLRRSGGTTLLNPKRYGAMSWIEFARHRLSVFTREEAQAIVAYMTYKRENDTTGLDHARIDTALKQFWLDRAENAPTRANLEAHLQEEGRYMAAIRLQRTREEKH